MERWQNRVAVVTGASSGIGAATVKQLLEAGLIVVGLARRLDRMEELRDGIKDAAQRKRLHIIKCDVSDLDSVNAAFDAIESKCGGIDILVNNAGTYIPGHLMTMEIATMQHVLQTNVMGVVYCTRRGFKSMQTRNVDGHVFIVNSIVGHKVFPPPDGSVTQFNMYPCTKFAVTAMTEIMRQEFKGLQTKVKITSISPGVVDTEILPPQFRAMPMLQSEDIAQGILYAISTPPHVQVHELTIKPMGEIF